MEATEPVDSTTTELGALLDAGDTAVVTLVAGDTHLAAHRAVLAARSPLLVAELEPSSLEGSSGQLAVPGMEGPALRQFLACLYTLQAPQLPSMLSQLLAASDRYGLPFLKAHCERQMIALLSVETAASTAALAVRHSCDSLKRAAFNFIRAHTLEVMASEGWGEAVRTQPEDVIEMSRLLSELPTETSSSCVSESSRTEANEEVKEEAATDLGALLDAGDGTMVTLVAGDTCLVAHRAVLAARSPVFADKFRYDTLEVDSGQFTIPDVEGPVLRQLLAFLYTLQAPHLPGMASQLLTAANIYGVSTLKAACESQVVAQLSVETATASAVLAVRHSCDRLKLAAFNFIRDHTLDVMASQGWADAVRTQPEDIVEVSRLLFQLPTETSAEAYAEDGTTASASQSHSDLGQIPASPPVLTAAHTSPVPDDDVAISRMLMQSLLALSTTDSGTAVTSQPPIDNSNNGQTIATAAIPTAARISPLLDDAAISRMMICSVIAEAATDCETTPTSEPDTDNRDDSSTRATAYSRIDAETTPTPAVREVSWNISEGGRNRNRRLIEAARKGLAGEVRSLLAAGADVRATDRKLTLWTALHWAADRGHVEVARCLLEAGADVDARNRLLQNTPLHYATWHGHVPVVQLLLAAGADPNAKSVDGRTPLHFAAYNGLVETVAVLLEAGADKGARSMDGHTPLDLAKQYRRQQVIDILS